MAKRRSWTDEQLISAVKESKMLTEVIRKLGFPPIGSHYHWVKKHIKRLNLSVEHFEKYKPNSPTNAYTNGIIPLSDFLIKGRTVHRSTKARLIKEGLLKEECSSCKIISWKGSITKDIETKLSLHLDHIDGDNTNNTLENLRLLCPNCHSLTSTYCGKNVKREKKYLICSDCSKTIEKGDRCVECFEKYKERTRKTTTKTWPSYEELKVLFTDSTFADVSQKLNCSDNGLRKYVQRIGKLDEVKKLTRSKNFRS